MDLLDARLHRLFERVMSEQFQPLEIYIYDFQYFCSSLYDVTLYIFLVIFIGMI